MDVLDPGILKIFANFFKKTAFFDMRLPGDNKRLLSDSGGLFPGLFDLTNAKYDLHGISEYEIFHPQLLFFIYCLRAGFYAAKNLQDSIFQSFNNR